MPQLPLLDQIWDSPLNKKGAGSVEPTQGCQKCDIFTLGVGTGTLDELACSHTRLAIYPALTICYQRVVIHASLDTRFKGRR